MYFGTFHVFNKSIANYTIFRDALDYDRMRELIKYYRDSDPLMSYSEFLRHSVTIEECGGIEKELVQILAYCFMPTHFHLVVEPLSEDALAIFLGRVQNAYTRYYNLRYGRRGPLWESKYKKVPVEDDDQLLHLSRYVHLNPSTAYLVGNPADWEHSSYLAYIRKEELEGSFLTRERIDMTPREYKKFVEDYRDAQRSQARIKELILE